MAKNLRKWKQVQNQEIKQIVADANIFRYTDKATLSVIEQKTRYGNKPKNPHQTKKRN